MNEFNEFDNSLDEKVKEYKDGHGCFVAIEVEDKKDFKVKMHAGGDNQATVVAICTFLANFAKRTGKKPSDLIPVVSDRLLIESEKQ